MKVSDIYKTDLDERFTKFSTLWEALLDEWETLAAEVPDAKHTFEIAYAGAIKTSEGTAQNRDADATLKTKDEYLMLLKLEARLEFVKAKIKWLDKEMSILQTRAANARAEMGMTVLPNQR